MYDEDKCVLLSDRTGGGECSTLWIQIMLKAQKKFMLKSTIQGAPSQYYSLINADTLIEVHHFSYPKHPKNEFLYSVLDLMVVGFFF